MEEQQAPKRQNTNATPPRNNANETTVVSPPSIIKISSPDGRLPKESSDADIETHIAQLVTLAAVPSSVQPQNKTSKGLQVYLTHVRVGDGNMHIIWAAQKNKQDHAVQLFPIANLPFDKSAGAIELRKNMGCQCAWVNRRRPDSDTKVLLEYPQADNGWKAMFSWNRTGTSHEEFIHTTLDTLANLLKNQKNIGLVEYKVLESEVRDTNLRRNEYPTLDKYLTVYSVSQVINYTFYRRFLVPKFKKKESSSEYQLDSRICMSFYSTHSDYVSYLFSRRQNGSYAYEARCWGYPDP